MTRYAHDTSVSADRSRTEIERRFDITRRWRRWLPHKATPGVRVRGTVRQIVGGRRWSLCLITAMEPVAPRAEAHEGEEA